MFREPDKVYTPMVFVLYPVSGWKSALFQWAWERDVDLARCRRLPFILEWPSEEDVEFEHEMLMRQPILW